MSKAEAPGTEESIVWKQFKKRRSGVISLYVIMALFGVAIYAPMLANNNPIALKTTYGVLYEYYFAGWQAVHNTTAEALANLDTIKATEASSLQGYNEARDALRALTDRYNDIGNRYEAARTGVEAAEEEIATLTAALEAAKAGGASTDALQAKLSAAEEKRVEAAEARKIAGGEKSQVQREMDEQRGRQTVFNEAILQARFAQDFDRQQGAVLLNIEQMTHFVDDGLGASLLALRERYAEAYDQVEGGDPRQALAAFEALKADAAAVAPEAAAEHLVYRWTFPVLGQLDLLDRAFALAYPFFLVLLLLGRRLRWSVAGRLAAAALAGAVLAAAAPMLSWDLPNRNYQDLTLDNVAAGYDDTWLLMPPVPYGMNENRFEEQYHPPAFVKNAEGQHSRHLLGTDDSGRDVTARMIWGARVSLSVGFVAVGLYLLIGIMVGAAAGYFGGRVDLTLSRIIEMVICFPSLFLILTVISFIGPSIYNVMIVIGLTGWTGIARLTRAEFLRLRGQDFVVAAEATGNSRAAIMFRHVLPNAMTPVLVSAAFGFAGSILLESGLSFLGFGVQEPFPSWGQMLANARTSPLLYPWLFFVPGIALFLTVTVYNLAGNAFRDASDPRLRR